VEGFRDCCGVGIQQQLVRIKVMAGGRVVRTVRAQAIVLPLGNAFDESKVNVAALRCELVMPYLIPTRIEQAKIYARCVMRPYGDIGTAIPQGEAEW
jgi:hypothetical protein